MRMLIACLIILVAIAECFLCNNNNMTMCSVVPRLVHRVLVNTTRKTMKLCQTLFANLTGTIYLLKNTTFCSFSVAQLVDHATCTEAVSLPLPHGSKTPWGSLVHVLHTHFLPISCHAFLFLVLSQKSLECKIGLTVTE